MKKFYSIIGVLVFGVMSTFAQSFTEDFEASNPMVGGYDNTTFVSSTNGLTWTLNSCRYDANAAFNIEGRSVMLRAEYGNVQSPVITDGLRQLSFMQHRSWSNTDDRTFTVVITDETTKTTQQFDFTRAGTDASAETFVIDGLTIDGDFSFVITNTTPSVPITIDNITWLGPNVIYENFENVDKVNTGYHDASFAATDGSTWNYTKSRSGEQNGTNALMMNSGWGQAQSSVIEGGVSSIVFTAQQVWTSNSQDRLIKVRVMDAAGSTILKNYDLTYNSVAQAPIVPETYIVDVTGVTVDCKVFIINTSPASHELLLDDLYITKNSGTPTSIDNMKPTGDIIVRTVKDGIAVDGLSACSMVAIFDITGRCITKQLVNNAHAMIPVNSKGLHIVHVNEGGNTTVKKVVLQ
ncbi:T9SS type A sorting domain-containing protein [Labilibacter sediminis]|nr:T9SS type A sorting domain-containing protein [Labilibacter sediminis]